MPQEWNLWFTPEESQWRPNHAHQTGKAPFPAEAKNRWQQVVLSAPCSPSPSAPLLPPSPGDCSCKQKSKHQLLPFIHDSRKIGFPDSSVGKESTCNAGDPGSIPGLERRSGEGKGYPLHYSGLENSTHCIVHGVAKSWTQLSNFHFPERSQAGPCYSKTVIAACTATQPSFSESVSVQWEKRMCLLNRFSPVRLLATLGTITCQAPLSIAFSRQEYWSGLPCSPPGDFPDPGINPCLCISCVGRLVIYH